MSGHTSEPWAISKGCAEYICNGDVWIAATMGVRGPQGEANARRIVAAVNATAGISTEALEAGVVAALVKAASALSANDGNARAGDPEAQMDFDCALFALFAALALAKVKGETA